ncbi:cobalt transporter [Silicimonas algicola]|nr:CbtA family protein [Silicimonas algicola]AZQ67309.1 cobalt transporter [Silicimonas algicola]
MFPRLLTSALIAGAGAGLLAALLQLIFVQPLLLQAELYETGQLTHFGADGSPAGSLRFAGIDPLRDGLTVVFSMLVYCGYALILVALMALAEMRGAGVDARRGILWGVAGFVVAQMAPAVSLAPELPGSLAGEVEARQVWWFACVISAAVALWLIAFGRSWPAWAAAVVLLLAPHLWGAPMPEAFGGPVPPELAALFAARVLGVGLAVWAVLGVLAGALWNGERDG